MHSRSCFRFFSRDETLISLDDRNIDSDSCKCLTKLTSDVSSSYYDEVSYFLIEFKYLMVGDETIRR